MDFSFNLNLIALPQLLIAVFLLVQGIMVIAQNRDSGLNRSFFVFELAVFVWLFGMGLTYMASDRYTAFLLSRIGFLGVLYIPATTYLFSVYYLGAKKQKTLAFLGLAVTFLFSLFIGTEQMAIGVYEYAWGYYIRLGPLGIGGLLLFLVLSPLFIRNFYLKYRESATSHNRQGHWRYLALVTGSLAFLAVTDFLPSFGVSLGVPPLGFLFVGILSTLMGYFILRYRIIDIEIVAGRGIGHFIMTGILLMVYGSIFALLSPPTATYDHIIFNMVFFVCALYVFVPLKERSQRIVDELFARERLNLDKLTAEFTTELRNLTDTPTLMANVFIFLTERLRFKSGAIFILKQNEKQWTFFQSTSIRAGGANLHRDTTITTSEAGAISGNMQIIDAGGLADPEWKENQLVSEIIGIIRERREVVAFPLMLRGIFLGFLSIGARLSGKDFTNAEFAVLTQLAGSLAFAIENAQAYEALQVANKSKNDFVTIISHQLRTPLTNIKWITETLLADAKSLTDDARLLIEKANISVEAMVNLIRQLLDTVSTSKDPSEISTPFRDLRTMLDGVTDDYQPLMTRKGISFEKSLPQTLQVIVRANKGYLRIILSVLLDNATRYTQSGGKINLEVTLQSVRNLQFAITDNGIGIPEVEQSRVFEKFFRASSAISLQPDGTGLGLFYAKQLVEGQGGHIWFRSREGQGTSFYFTLPLVAHGKSSPRSNKGY